MIIITSGVYYHKPRSLIEREKISKTMKVYRQINKPWNAGLSKEIDNRLRILGQRISESTKGEKNHFYGKHHSVETNKKISINRKGQGLGNQYGFKKGIIPWNKGKSMDEKYKAVCREGRLKQEPKFKMTKIEIKVQKWLDLNSIVYEQHKIFRDSGGRFASIVDFYVPFKNLVIECDGDYWHSLPKNIEYDKRKELLMQQLGINMLRLKEKDINNNFATCMEVLWYAIWR